jgi:hypothetical protein
MRERNGVQEIERNKKERKKEEEGFYLQHTAYLLLPRTAAQMSRVAKPLSQRECVPWCDGTQ